MSVLFISAGTSSKGGTTEREVSWRKKMEAEDIKLVELALVEKVLIILTLRNRM